MDGLYVESERGEKSNYPRYYRQALDKLAKSQRLLSRRKKVYERWENQRRIVAMQYYKIANKRINFDAVIIEDLDMKGMSQALNFGKSVHDNGWGMFTNFLEYKLKEQGKQLVKIDKWFPSTKKCSCCGTEKEIPLSERVYKCSCGFVLDRDHNSAINVKKEGLRLLALA